MTLENNVGLGLDKALPLTKTSGKTIVKIEARA
jgi:hypothetical protein